jgi:hypothetical protein
MQVLGEETHGSRLLGRSRRRWDLILKWILKKRFREGMDWIDLARDRDVCRAFVNTVMNLQVS